MVGIGERRTEEGNQHFRYQRSIDIGEVIISVIVLLDLHAEYLNKWEGKQTNIQIKFSILCLTPQTMTTTTPEY